MRIEQMKFRCEYTVETDGAHVVDGDFETNDGYYPSAEKKVQTLFGPGALITHCRLVPIAGTEIMNLPEPKAEPKKEPIGPPKPEEVFAEEYIDYPPPVVIAQEISSE